jgi:hypothetical protein
MSLTPETTVFDAVDEGQSFTYTVVYTNEAEAVDPPPETPPETPPDPIIESVVSSVEDSTINIEFVDNTVTISGSYNNAFPGKTFEYIPKGKQGTIISVPFNQIPLEIDALVKYNAVAATSTTVTYTVITDSGTATISQLVKNNWDAGKAQMLTALARGAY